MRGVASPLSTSRLILIGVLLASTIASSGCGLASFSVAIRPPRSTGIDSTSSATQAAHLNSEAKIVSGDTATLVPTSTGTPLSTPTLAETLAPTLTQMPLPRRTSTLAPPTLAPDPSERTAHVLILVYHYIRPYPDRASDPLGYNLSVPQDLFDRQLDDLVKHGFQAIRLGDLVSYLRTGTPSLPPKPVVITFDDGYEDAFSSAFPILSKYSFPGTFFIISNFVGEGRAGYLNWAQVRTLAQAGMEIGSHTLTHADLTAKAAAIALQELEQSRQEIELHLGRPVDLFAYPFGHVDDRVQQMTAQNYAAAVTTLPGSHHSSSNLYRIRRLEVNGSWSLAEFGNIVTYYWNGPK